MRGFIFLTLFNLFFNTLYSQPEKNARKKEYTAIFHLNDGTLRSGVWHSCSAAGISFAEGIDQITLTPEQVYKFEIKRSNSSKRNALIGAGFGFMLGFLIAFNDSDADARAGYARAGYAGGVGLLSAFAGAFIGHLIGMSGKTYYIMGRPDQLNKLLPELQKYNRSPIP
jgi:hypothetical protein